MGAGRMAKQRWCNKCQSGQSLTNRNKVNTILSTITTTQFIIEVLKMILKSYKY